MLRISMAGLALLLTFFLLPTDSRDACAQTSPEQKVWPARGSVESITSAGEEKAAELAIRLTKPSPYNIYKADNPLRTIIDLPGVSPGSAAGHLMVNKGNIRDVVIKSYDTDTGILTRMEIGLAGEHEAVFATSTDNPSEMKLTYPSYVPPLPLHTDTAGQKAAKAAEKPVVAVKKKNVAANNKKALYRPKAAAKPKGFAPGICPQKADKCLKFSKRLNRIYESENCIILSVAGGVGKLRIFKLHDPVRYVIDIYDATTMLPALTRLNSRGIEFARVALHPDKVRVVLDADKKFNIDPCVMKTKEGLAVRLSQNEATNVRTN